MLTAIMRFAPGTTPLRPGDHVVSLPKDVRLSRHVRQIRTGKAKGAQEWECADGSLATFAPDVEVDVRRQVPDQAERDAFVASMRGFYTLVEAVEARAEVRKAVATLHAVLNDDRFEGALLHAPIGMTVLDNYPSKVEVAVATFRAVYGKSRRTLTGMGHSLEDITRMATSDSMLGGDGGLYEHLPPRPANTDCYADGYPAQREQQTFDTAPLNRPDPQETR